jgi:uncharacterized protein
MKFTQQRLDGVNLIRRYGSDYILVGERELRESCIVGASSITPWSPRNVDELVTDHLHALFALAPEIVVLATGTTQRFPRAALRAEFASRKVGLEVMEMGAACRTYNVLVGEDRRVLAAVLLPGARVTTEVPSKQSE